MTVLCITTLVLANSEIWFLIARDSMVNNIRPAPIYTLWERKMSRTRVICLHRFMLSKDIHVHSECTVNNLFYRNKQNPPSGDDYVEFLTSSLIFVENRVRIDQIITYVIGRPIINISLLFVQFSSTESYTRKI